MCLHMVVRPLIDEDDKMGRYEARWDGRDDGGQRVSGGVYFYRMQSGNFKDVRKLVVIK